MRLLFAVLAMLPLSTTLLFPMSGGGGGGCCCQQQQQCCPPPQPCCCCPPPQPCCCCPPPQPCCCGGGGGCGGGGFGRKKREINHIQGEAEKSVGVQGVPNAQCNSVEISEMMKKTCKSCAVVHLFPNANSNYFHMNETELPAVKSAIYQGLVALYPKQAFTVVCVDGAVSYQADSNRYCVEGNMDHNCYVFML